VFGVSLSQVYATNVFPFIKAGGMSSTIRRKAVLEAAHRFTRRELAIARPKTVLALGKLAANALSEIGIGCHALPHPAARIGSTDRHEDKWCAALGKPQSRRLANAAAQAGTEAAIAAP
jgi:restriction system protein